MYVIKNVIIVLYNRYINIKTITDFEHLSTCLRFKTMSTIIIQYLYVDFEKNAFVFILSLVGDQYTEHSLFFI